MINGVCNVEGLVCFVVMERKKKQFSHLLIHMLCLVDIIMKKGGKGKLIIQKI